MPIVTTGEGPNGQPADPWLPPPDGSGLAPLLIDAATVRVMRLDPDAFDNNTEGGVEELDNVRVVEIRRSIGVDPGTARLRYIFDGIRDHPLSPTSFEEALSTLGEKPKTIRPGDRIQIGAYRPGDGLFKPLFDGEAISFEGAISARDESVTILCRGIAARCLDDPIPGATYRDGNEPLTISDRDTDVDPHFNPKGKANCCPDGDPRGKCWRVEAEAPEGQTYPTFMDPDNTHADDEAPTFWDLPKAVRYLCYKHNDERFVLSPDPEDIDRVLVAKVPKDDTSVVFNPIDPDTFDAKTILAPDKPVGGKDWPGAVRDLIADKGFETRWDLESGSNGSAVTRMVIFDPRTTLPQDILLQPRGATLDLASTNVSGGSFARDLSGVVNDWEVQGDFVEVEATFILACGFPNTPGLSVFDDYKKTSPNFGDHYNDFRLFVLDESGEGHYQPNSATKETDLPDLDDALGAKVDGERTWSARRRRPAAELLTEAGGDAPAGTKLKATLAISTDYEGSCPGVWDGSGTWQPIDGSYTLLHDRIGVWINSADANAVHIGKPPASMANPPYPAGVVKMAEALSNDTGENKKFFLRLTCVVRRDVRVFGYASRTPNDPLGHTVKRFVDAHDRYKRQVVLKDSEFARARGPFTEDIVIRDDKDACTAEATALQQATMYGVMGGTILVPWLTLNYELGTRIRSLYGRGLGFRTDGGGEEAAPQYPIVTAIRHTFEPQATELELSDATIARVPYTKRTAKRHAVPPGGRRSTRG